MLDCGCPICTAYHAHRREVNRIRRAEYERAREQTPERRAYKAARTAEYVRTHTPNTTRKKNK